MKHRASGIALIEDVVYSNIWRKPALSARPIAVTWTTFLDRHPLLSDQLADLRSRAENLASEQIAPFASSVDEEHRWPEHSFRALAEAGLMGLLVPKRLGGMEEGLLSLAVVTEALGQRCASTAMCYGMHCVGTAVIAAKATPYQSETFLRPIAEGRHITTIALSEGGTGSHFYLPETTFQREKEGFVIRGEKVFVTNAGHADSYVVSTAPSVDGDEGGEFSCFLVDGKNAGLTWTGDWQGLGMRGNASRSLQLKDVRVPVNNLLGEEGEQTWYVFEVVAPYFLMAMAGTYLGVAQAAVDLTLQHVRTRRHSHSGESLAHAPVVQHRVAEMWMSVQSARCLIYEAARLGDLGDPTVLPSLLSCKIAAAQTAVAVTNEAMTLCGGMAYRENSTLARLLRDARASHVMSPTTDILKLWAGRALLGLPLL